jgi:predicted lipoprotein with Yx(FWY)xxD motif
MMLSKMVSNPAKVGLGLVAGALTLAACSSGSSSSGSGGGTGTGSASGGRSGTNGASTGSSAEIKTATGPDGTYLVDAAGKALYLWAADTGKTSTCTGPCASVWPPVTTKGAPTVAGSAVATDLGTTTRSDGTMQVTYKAHPLYYYEGDSAPGDVTGQGSNSFNAKWWLVAPSGAAITTTSGASSAGSTSGPYG